MKTLCNYLLVCSICVLSIPAMAWELASELARNGHYAQAALEFRRLSLQPHSSEVSGVFSWLAGYAYWQADRYWQAERMIEAAESQAPALETELYLLRAGNARARRRPDEAAFYLESLTEASRPEYVRRYATLHLAAARVEAGELDAARAGLEQTAFDVPDSALKAIDKYDQGHDKRLVVGGLLGLIPGLGYAYSGEYANALRSFILNALCIWGVVEFAEEEQWGGVAIVGFAGVTFYSGSIYGGVDAAARYNRRRRQACTRAIEQDARFEPNYMALPVLDLKFHF